MREPGPDMPGPGQRHVNEPEDADGTPGWARRELAREVDRARYPSAVTPTPKSTGNLSVGWRALEQRARRGVRGAAEPADGAWKRPVKRALLRLLRPLVRRYEDLIAELTAYGDSLAKRLEETEAELARLSGREAPGASGSPGESQSDSTATATDPS